MTTILIRAHKHPFRVADAAETLAKNLIGGNAGNLIFSQAVCRLLSTSQARIRTASLPREPVPADFDRLVLPLANAFRPGYADRVDRLAEIVEQSKAPVTVLGVGAQAALDGRPARRLDESVRRFVRAALRNGSGPVGVRGEFTRDYLIGLGFNDDEISVIGCPSMFMWGPDLKITKKVPRLRQDSPIALNISPYVPRIGPISRSQAARYPRLVYLAQNLQTLELLITGSYPGDPESAVMSIGGPVDLDHPLIAEDRVRFFLDPTTWIRFLAGCDFSYGTRIHGNIAALLAGVPALVLVHDARTRELAEYHQIPYRLITDRTLDVDAAELYEATDWDPVNKVHADRWEVFRNFLAQHGLRTVFDQGEDRGAAFDRGLAAINFPAPARTMAALSLPDLYALRAENAALRDELAGLRASRDRLLLARGRVRLQRLRRRLGDVGLRR